MARYSWALVEEVERDEQLRRRWKRGQKLASHNYGRNVHSVPGERHNGYSSCVTFYRSEYLLNGTYGTFLQVGQISAMPGTSIL